MTVGYSLSLSAVACEEAARRGDPDGCRQWSGERDRALGRLSRRACSSSPLAGWATWRQNLERVARTIPDLDPHVARHRLPQAGRHDRALRERWPRSAAPHYIRPRSDAPRSSSQAGSAKDRTTPITHELARGGPVQSPVRKTPTILAVDSTQEQLDEMEATASTNHPPLMREDQAPSAASGCSTRRRSRRRDVSLGQGRRWSRTMAFPRTRSSSSPSAPT